MPYDAAAEENLLSRISGIRAEFARLTQAKDAQIVELERRIVGFARALVFAKERVKALEAKVEAEEPQ